MKATLNHIQKGIVKWYSKEAATLGWNAVLVSPLVALAVSNLLRKKGITLLLDENGEIDIDCLYRDYAEIVSKSGSIEIYGFKINAQDIDHLYESIKSEVPPVSGINK